MEAGRHPAENLAVPRAAAEADMVAVCHAPYLINLAGTDGDRRALGAALAPSLRRRAASAPRP